MRQLGYAPGQLRCQPRQLAFVLAHVRRKHVLGRVRDVVPQRLDEGLIGQVHVLVTGAEQHYGPVGMRRQRRLGGETRLADSRLTGDEH